MAAPVTCEVTVFNGDLEGALKAFKKQAVKSGLFAEWKRKSFYRKPSEARTFKRSKARKQRLKAAKRREERDMDRKPSTNGAHA